jgi:hypothetical protein
VFDDPDDSEAALLLDVSSTNDFGFTIGSTPSILGCISTVTTIGNRLLAKEVFEGLVDDAVSNVLSCLGTCEGATWYASDSALSKYQLNSFISATYIYLHRILFDLPSVKLVQWVDSTLRDVIAFHSESDSNFSIRPAFIAAAEAYTYENMALARRWLHRTTKFGIGSRQPVCKVVEEVWRRREVASQELGIDSGLISVDWREVMADLDLEILLI